MDSLRTIKLSVIVVSVLCAVLAGCDANEQLVRTGVHGPTEYAPDWVRGRMPLDEEYIYFIGRGVGHNILDERGAYDGARDHVMQQIARQIATRIEYSVREQSGRGSATGEADSAEGSHGSGPWPWGRIEGMSAEVASEALIATSALVGDVEEREIYWEEWRVNDRPDRWCSRKRGVMRYKCWVLMAIPRASFERRVAHTMAVLELEAQRRLTLAQAQATLEVIRAEEDMKLRVIASVAQAESERFSEIGGERVFDVIDTHDHRLSSGRNFNRQDTIRLLQAARIRRATGVSIYSPAEVSSFLDEPETSDNIYDLLDERN